ncbi:MAG: cytochrome c biogenesis protein CcdA [Dehalococcoidia bacterium]|nr:cytochrome c biogenesis protein CcdA [Dehalococcoidia bacterium]
MFEIGGVSALLAFAAGFASFLSPCVLPLVPVYLANMAEAVPVTGNSEKSFWSFFPHALLFVAGFTIIFVLLGALVGILGSQIRPQINLISRIAGVFVMIFGLQMLGVIRLPFLNRTFKPYINPVAKLRYMQSFLLGMSFAVGWTPCIGPTLGSILSLGINSGEVAKSTWLLFIYSVGLGIPFLATGAATGYMTKLLKGASRYMRVIEILSGALLILAGFLLVTGTLTRFNEYFQRSGLGTQI